MVVTSEEFLKSLGGRGFLGNRGHYGKGSEGLGDPDERTLQEIEKKVVIPSYAREIILRDYCNYENQEYEKCRHDTHFYNRFYTCSEHKRILNSCVENWLNKPQLTEQATAEYLEERRLFRITGLTKDEREDMANPSPGIAASAVNKIRSFLLKEDEMKQYEENKNKKRNE